MGNRKKAEPKKVPFMSVEQPSMKRESSHDDASMSRSAHEMKAVKLPDVVKKLMQKKGVSARTLSRACEIPMSTMSSYLTGRKASYSPQHLMALAEFFSVSVEYILTGKERSPVNLELLPTSPVFAGWLKVKVERYIPSEPDDEKE